MKFFWIDNFENFFKLCFKTFLYFNDFLSFQSKVVIKLKNCWNQLKLFEAPLPYRDPHSTPNKGFAKELIFILDEWKTSLREEIRRFLFRRERRLIQFIVDNDKAWCFIFYQFFLLENRS